MHLFSVITNKTIKGAVFYNSPSISYFSIMSFHYVAYLMPIFWMYIKKIIWYVC